MRHAVTSLALMVIVVLAGLLTGQGAAARGPTRGELDALVASVPGVSDPQHSAIAGALMDSLVWYGLAGDGGEGAIGFPDTGWHAASADSGLGRACVESMRRIVCAGVLEEGEPEEIASIAWRAYAAEWNGAAAAPVEQLALIGLSSRMGVRQLEMAARGLQRAARTSLPGEVYEALLACALEQDWSGEVIQSITDGLLAGHELGVDAWELALALSVRVGEGLRGESLSQAIEEELDFALGLRSRDSQDAERHSTAYEGFGLAVSNGVPRQVAARIYRVALSDGWPVATIEAAYQGLVRGAWIGLSVGVLAEQLIDAVACSETDEDPYGIVSEAIARVKGADRQRLAALSEARAFGSAPDLAGLREDERTKPRPSIQTPGQRSVMQKAIRGELVGKLNLALLRESLWGFLAQPAPYRWKGQTRKGADSSGFAVALYREQCPPIQIPDQPESQCQVGQAVKRADLACGDLVFFDRFGDGHATHVGVYVGEGWFVHGTTRGVVVSRMDSPLYQSRYVCARRIALPS